MARTKQTPGVSPNLQSSAVMANVDDLGDPPHLDPAVEMADVSDLAHHDSVTKPLPLDQCKNLQITIEEYALSVKGTSEVEAQIRQIHLFPFMYGAQDVENLNQELLRWKEEKERIEGKLNLLFPCPNTGCLHNQQIANVMKNINSKNINTPTPSKKRQHENATDGFIIPNKTAKQPKPTPNQK
ncbi:hypothetical protein NPIL_19791 [Nephila pilipes]|uniref:Uncharacterized protein n=1 Tax=Nephila pilipes TaxID=299642 RepID=A0A8X6U0L1_NEPPI|nr:hypothetical protein NPIL_19791 [Nephila pilipes]